MKKKVLVLVIDTELTNEQIERDDSTVISFKDWHQMFDCRNVRVIDVDEITGELETPHGTNSTTREEVFRMIQSTGTSRQALYNLLCKEVQNKREALGR